MFKYMDRFGFNAKPPARLSRLPARRQRGLRRQQLLGPSDAIDIGRVAIGQERLQVTPLQMAEVAATVANKGELMEPRLWSKVIDPDGRETKLDPDAPEPGDERGHGRRANDDDADVVNEGTGTAAARRQGIDVAGKTGTAEIDRHGVNQAWFIGFAPANDPQIAIAVHRRAHQRLRRPDLRADLQGRSPRRSARGAAT